MRFLTVLPICFTAVSLFSFLVFWGVSLAVVAMTMDKGRKRNIYQLNSGLLFAVAGAIILIVNVILGGN